MIFGKYVAKSKAFVNKLIFLQQYFYFGGGNFLSVPPGGAYAQYNIYHFMLQFTCDVRISLV